MMKRRRLVIAFGLSPLVAHVVSFAQQQAGRIFRIGFLAGMAPPPDGRSPTALRQALVELGYVDGKNVVYEGRWAEGKQARLPDLAAELVRLRMDAIVVMGDAASPAAKQATSTIPIVLAGHSDAAQRGGRRRSARPVDQMR